MLFPQFGRAYFMNVQKRQVRKDRSRTYVMFYVPYKSKSVLMLKILVKREYYSVHEFYEAEL